VEQEIVKVQAQGVVAHRRTEAWSFAASILKESGNPQQREESRISRKIVLRLNC